MIMEFRKSRVIYFAMSLLLSVLVVVALMPRGVEVDGRLVYVSLLTGNRELPSVILMWMLIVMALFLVQIPATSIASSVGNREFKKIAALLLEQCDPDAFLTKMEPLLKKGGRQTMLVKYHLLGKGYIARGDYDKAIDLCAEAQQAAKVQWITPDMQVSLCGVYANTCIAYAEAGQIDKAVKLYTTLKTTANGIRGRGPEASEALHLPVRDYIAIFAKEGYDDTQALEQHVQKMPSKFDRVIYHYALARFYERLQKQPQAEQSYQYVAANGNTMACAAAARQRLQQKPSVEQ